MDEMRGEERSVAPAQGGCGIVSVNPGPGRQREVADVRSAERTSRKSERGCYTAQARRAIIAMIMTAQTSPIIDTGGTLRQLSE
jgi:hypothetical protein